MSYNIWFDGRFPSFADQMSENRASPRSLNTEVIALDGYTMWLIESHPMLHSITKSFEAGVCIVLKILPAKKYEFTSYTSNY